MRSSGFVAVFGDGVRRSLRGGASGVAAAQTLCRRQTGGIARVSRRITCAYRRPSKMSLSAPTTAETAPGGILQDADIAIITRARLEQRVRVAIEKAFGDEYRNADPLITQATKPEFGDYQCNAAMGMAKKIRMKPRDVANKIVEVLDVQELCEPPAIAGPGFINLKLHDRALNGRLQEMLADRQRMGVRPRTAAQRILVDFSSPNVAKEMHVGHLRSTIIGESICRLLEFLGHDVLRINHVGDWGTQFGMLILYIQQKHPEVFTDSVDVSIGDLAAYYKAAKTRFDEDESFKEQARKEVVKLQSGYEDSLRAWRRLCDLSRREFQRIYELLGVSIAERGESFYNPYLSDILHQLQNQNLAVEDDGARVVFVEGNNAKQQAVIVQKRDGAYNYETTDLAAIRYRTHDDGAKRVIYVTDVGQSDHFVQVFKIARMAGFVAEDAVLEHVPFGLVLGDDGRRFRTRSGETVRLKDLLDEAVNRARADYISRLKEAGREEDEEEVERISKVIGLSSVKYADLKTNRLSNYKFSYDRMLAMEGNTAPYMLYTYARMQGIRRNVGDQVTIKDEDVNFILDDPNESALARHLVRLPELLADTEKDLQPSSICDYMYELCQRFSRFYVNCSIVHADNEELKASRFGLVNLTEGVLRLCLDLLGIQYLDRI